MQIAAACAISFLLLCAPVAADSGWEKTTTGSLVANPLPQPDETVTWSGGCVAGKASGNGVEVFRYRGGGTWLEERYEGEMKDGRPDGRGTMYYDNGDRYQGTYAAGRRFGAGTYVHVNGDRYVGEFTDDKPTGHATFVYHDGGVYDGQFVNGSFEGHGTFTFADGGRYEGAFHAGMANGTGTYTSSTGEVASGNWVNGCLRQGPRVAAVGTTREKCHF